MLNKDKLIQSFEEIIGWPYVSPGTNDRNGIDCSGAFVRAFQAQGASIYHGSNTIYRQYCSEVGKITSISQLQPGMAVFKHRADGNEPDKFKKDGIGNLYHIGLVVSVSPLRIIHATPPKAKVDAALGTWSHYGKLKNVNYEGLGQTEGFAGSLPPDGVGATSPNGEGTAMENLGDVLYVARVTAKSGGTVNLRKAANKDAEVLAKVPIGSNVSVYREADGWAQVRCAGQMGYMMLEYLVDVESIPDGAGTGQDAQDTDGWEQVRMLAQALVEALQGVL